MSDGLGDPGLPAKRAHDQAGKGAESDKRRA